ncbi:MAG: hypothetical protein DRP63_03480 [Planctomycetota bacterium]|nr:MAG: hypothetical protein DRP63_03480 [Planctomycetota bacterium]
MCHKVLYKDFKNHKVLLHSDGSVTYQRHRNINYRRLTGVEAAQHILLGEQLQHCYIESLSRGDFKKAHRNLQKRGDELADAFNAEGRVQLHIGARVVEHQGIILNRPLVCPNCIVGSCDLSDILVAGRADFHGTLFVGSSRFSGTVFASDSWFWDCEFGGFADFVDTQFAGSASFYNSRFLCDSDFMGAKFASEADFTAAKFAAYVEFWNANFQDTVHLQKAQFLLPASFKDANFRGRVNFQNARFLILELDTTSFDRTCYMQNIAAQKMDLNAAVFRENLILSASDDISCWLRKIEENIERLKEGLTQKSVGKSDIEVEMMLKRYVEERLEEFRRRLQIWRDAKRGICSLNFGGTVIQGELVCDFKDLEPVERRGRLCAVVEAHRMCRWEDAEKQYAWLGERYRRRGAHKDHTKALHWAAHCARQTARQRLLAD